MKISTPSFLFYSLLLFILISCNNDTMEEILPVVVDFTFSIEDNQIVTFTNKSENATSYEWDFGDGNFSTEENPTHQYSLSDCHTFNVELTAHGDKTSSATKELYINLPASPNLEDLNYAPTQSRHSGIHFTHNGKGYIGLGYFAYYFGGFRGYNPSSDSWDSHYPEAGLVGGAWFIIDDILYFGLGENAYHSSSTGEPHSFNAYDLASETVVLLDEEFPLSSQVNFVNFPIGFSYDGKGYVLADYPNNPNGKIMYQFDPVTQSWTDIGSFPCSATSNMMHFVIDGKLYVGLGKLGAVNSVTYVNDFWEYDLELNTWSQKNDFPLNSPVVNNISFTRNGKG